MQTVLLLHVHFEWQWHYVSSFGHLTGKIYFEIMTYYPPALRVGLGQGRKILFCMMQRKNTRGYKGSWGLIEMGDSHTDKCVLGINFGILE